MKNNGTGKSTHTRLWREYLGERAVMINDDRPLIRVKNDGITVFGAPCCGKHKIGNNIAVPLKAICILGRTEENTIQRITKSEALTIGTGRSLVSNLPCICCLMENSEMIGVIICQSPKVFWTEEKRK